MVSLPVLSARWRRFPAVVAGFCLLLAAAAMAGAWLVPLPHRLESGPSTVVYYADGTPAHVFLSPDDKWRIAVPLEDIAPEYVKALIRFEDKRFYLHPGFDPLALARAAVGNFLGGRVVSGASTITMQLVRVLEPRPRNYRSKIVELLRAVQLELRLSKREILEAYLRYIPFGRNIEGVEAASLAYFGHRAGALSSAEIATLLAVPQHPEKRYPTVHNAKRLATARDDILAFLRGENILGEEDAAAPAAPRALLPFPREAPHAAVWLRERFRHAHAIRTTLSRDVQLHAERIVTDEAARARQNGIRNTGVVVADHDGRTVLALVGNFSFDDETASQIPSFAAPRSPGSLLKPVLYAMAIDRGLALPDYLIPDIPTAYPAYEPQNYDGEFRGLVRLEDALSQSLNLPFVNLLQQIGIENFLGTLRGLGVESLVETPGWYGLSAAVGGLEMSPLEAAGIYAALARDGRAFPLAITAGTGTDASRKSPGVPVLSPGAAWLTRQALSLRDRPDFPLRMEHAALPPGIHWKTGTSYGHHDAWAAGSAGRYTAVVWQGNLDRTTSTALVGAEAAGPVLFDLLEGLVSRGNAPAPDLPPGDLTPVEVCAYSGHIPTHACPTRRTVLARTDNVPTAPCPYHVGLEIDKASGLAVGPLCRAGRETEGRTFLRFPATIRRWLKDRNRNLPEPPARAPWCAVAGDGARPEIISPTPGQVVVLIAGLDADHQEIPFEAETQVPGATLSWFVNGRFLAAARADSRVWWTPEAGSHEILVQDEAGRKSRRILQVRAR